MIGTDGLDILVQKKTSIFVSVPLDAFSVQRKAGEIMVNLRAKEGTYTYLRGPVMIDTTSLTRLRLPAQVTGYGTPPVAPSR